MDSILLKSRKKSSDSRYWYGKAMEMEDHRKGTGWYEQVKEGIEAGWLDRVSELKEDEMEETRKCSSWLDKDKGKFLKKDRIGKWTRQDNSEENGQTLVQSDNYGRDSSICWEM